MEMKYGLPTSTPEAQGLSSRVILDFIDEIEREYIELQGLIIMRHGYIITDGYWAPFAVNKPHRMFSSRKAVIATAILFAIQEGLLSLEDRMVDLFPEEIPSSLSENLKQLTIYHMLTMTTGHAEDPFIKMFEEGADAPALFFQNEFVYKPGLHFLYDNGVPAMLGILIHRKTGKSVLEYLQPRLFEPLGMTSFCAHKTNSLIELLTICCSTADLFRLTYFYFQRGKWQGKELLDGKLAKMACSFLVPSLQDPEPNPTALDTKFGYGFQIWRNSVGGFRIDGGRGQFGIGIPEMDLIACMNSYEGDQNIIPALFWKHITNRLYAEPLKEDAVSYDQLNQKLMSLSKAPTCNAASHLPCSGIYQFSESMLGCDRLGVNYKNQRMEFTIYSADTSTLFAVGETGKWQKGISPFIFPENNGSKEMVHSTVPGFDSWEVYSSGHWISPTKYEVIFRSDAWLGSHVLTLSFAPGYLLVLHEDGSSHFLRQRGSILKLANPPGLYEYAYPKMHQAKQVEM
jgi:Beta-lactamase